MATVKIRGTKGNSRRPEGFSVLDLVGDRRFKLAKRVLMGSDDKNRLALGKLARKGEGYNVYVSDDGQILLDPIVTIPASERWVFDNPERIASIDRGLAQAAAGELGEWPDFAAEPDTDD